MLCKKPFTLLFPIGGALSFFAILVYYGLFQMFDSLTYVQRQATIIFIVSNAFLLVILPLAHLQTPGWYIGATVQLGFFISFILAIVASIQFSEVVTVETMTEYFDTYFDAKRIPPAYIEYIQQIKNDCCGVSGPNDYKKFWNTSPLNTKEFHFPDSCCKIGHLMKNCASLVNKLDDKILVKKIHQKGCAPDGIESFPKFYQDMIFLLNRIIPPVITFEILCLTIIFNIYFIFGRNRQQRRRLQVEGQRDSTTPEKNQTETEIENKTNCKHLVTYLDCSSFQDDENNRSSRLITSHNTKEQGNRTQQQQRNRATKQKNQRIPKQQPQELVTEQKLSMNNVINNNVNLSVDNPDDDLYYQCTDLDFPQIPSIPYDDVTGNDHEYDRDHNIMENFIYINPVLHHLELNDQVSTEHLHNASM